MAQGRRLQHYELIEEIGRGGMGQVWRAKDTRLGRDVAVKILPEEFSDDAERLRRFEREAKLLASLNHPHVAQIYGVDQVGDTCFIVMELVGGEPLSERIARAGSPWTRRSTSAGRSPRGSKRRTRPASCIATSSRPTSA